MSTRLRVDAAQKVSSGAMQWGSSVLVRPRGNALPEGEVSGNALGCWWAPIPDDCEQL